MAEPTTPTRVDEPLDQARIDTITVLLQEGRRVSEVIAHGLTRRPGWRRQHVVGLIEEKGWGLDSDGRIPRQHRSTQIVPNDPLPGAPAPSAPRQPVAQFPPLGSRGEPTRLGGPRPTPAIPTEAGLVSVSAMIQAGKDHDVIRVRNLADKADTALKELRTALIAEREKDVYRAELRQLEERRAELRAKIGGPGRKPGSGAGGNRPVKDTTKDKPINHGTWGGYLQHSKRGIPVPDDDSCGCNAAKDRQMAKLRGGSGA